MKAAISVPLTFLRRPHNLQPQQACGPLDTSYLFRKNDHTVVLSPAAFSTFLAAKSLLSYPSSQLC
jgi:hypothetical protein